MTCLEPRLARLLGGESLAPLRKRLRQRYERMAAEIPMPAFRIVDLTQVEHAALAALQGSSSRFSASMQIDVPMIDLALQRAGVCASLRAALEAIDGPIIDRAGVRAAIHAGWQQLIDDQDHPALSSLLNTSSGLRLLKRLAGPKHASAARLLKEVHTVLRRLPAAGITRAQLAAISLGDAHALDDGRPVATLVLAALRQSRNLPYQSAQEGVEDASASNRELWASAQVLVNELARPALFLNLPGIGIPGEPGYLSLRNLLRATPRYAVQDCKVFVCENPNLLAIAADCLGSRCAPLVCTDGMPSAAQRTLLNQLTRTGANLYYHGDFDWPGIHIGNHMLREHGARPWRFGAADYAAALDLVQGQCRLLPEVTVLCLWDEQLTSGMQNARRAIDEELVAEYLMHDLDQSGTLVTSR
ncbi:TIGR02679 family protein [Janthinobacterium sp. PC23-8]|uniref:TIGR02679 family protein n=1 Tax=Janthinobacterium sp. PC23-8 TaxID=2012679 RepID=UPI000B965354|nr:TIGR02679 family protein [Janthinobacterium sp. PC23-8]OYO28066.1 TIGR02679 family protein [Janthinobacterium sp. PC23-8]